MKPNVFTNTIPNRLKQVAEIGLCVVFFGVASASAQTDYSDTWLDDSNPDAGYIVGIGVTDNDYSADAIGVETTLTSPNGRTVSSSAYDYASVRLEITLPWEWDDPGDYSSCRPRTSHCVGATGTVACFTSDGAAER